MGSSLEGAEERGVVVVGSDFVNGVVEAGVLEGGVVAAWDGAEWSW